MTPTDESDEAESMGLEDHLEAMLEDPQATNRLLDRVLLEQGLHVPHGQRALFVRELRRTEEETVKILMARREGPLDASPAPSLRISEAVERYLKDRGLGSRGTEDVRSGMGRFIAIVGNKRMADLDRADARLYKAKLLESGLAPATVKKLLTGASTLCRFAVVEGWLSQNPFADGLTRVARKGAQTAGRLPYSPAQIVTLLTAGAKLEGASRWMPWMGAFTGGRREELGGCRVKDVKQEAGIWFLDIVATPERRLKNLGSARRVPLHPRLHP